MSELKGACIFGQSGGPTSVINASVYGVVDTALKSPAITQVLGAAHGIPTPQNERFYAAIKERRLVNRGFLCLIRIFAGFISGIRLCLTIVISLIIFVRISWHI